MLDNEKRCDKCQFWDQSEENPNIGECRVNAPMPYTSLVGETLEIHAMWPAPEAHEYCFQFVKKQEEVQKEKFSETKLIEWMDNYSPISEDYLIDIYPNENGFGISGKISLKPGEPDMGRNDLILEYLQRFFAPEDIDVSFS
ncbi:hypothetical protein LCGC14_1263920 [marine sediment metagenome]|uniref:Uncharacterized protein n=1 Tax=marine sediment metagenome TaxID=412755 RepID=A0A0F9L2B0_9ZZZZ